MFSATVYEISGLEPFARLQYEAVQAVASLRKEKPLEDYTLLFKKNAVTEVQALSFEQFRQVLQDTIVPQIHIAKNMGFVANWIYPNV
jgi:hypothetical protein